MVRWNKAYIKNTKDTLKMTSRWTGKAYAKDVEVDILPAVYNHIEDKYFFGYNKDVVKIGWIKLLTRDNYPNGFLKYTNSELLELLNNSYNTFVGG